MKVVGIDFGTTNVRISTWDSDTDDVPETHKIGSGGETTMPAVVALYCRAGGEVDIVAGEEAEEAVGDPNDTLIVPNIKRYALSNDSYVNWHLEARNTHEPTSKWPPTWWNPAKRCIQVWGQEFPVLELIGCILAEALARAEVTGEFEWRAGCPVHAGLEYRTELASTLRNLSGTGDANCVVEEPVLLMTLAHRLGDLRSGSYMVYDFGGGSFDCAVVEIDDDGQMIVYGADGHPLLGGADIDERLSDKLAYAGQMSGLRQAKEGVSSSNRPQTVAGVQVTPALLDLVLSEGQFANKSFMTMHDAYVAAKVSWKRRDAEDDPPIGEMLTRNRQTGGVGFVWQLKWADMAGDVDGIVLFGGPTKHVHVSQRLEKQFGTEKMLSTEQFLAKLRGEPDLELTAVSKGACYSYQDAYAPLYHSRLPARVRLEDLESGELLSYEPLTYLVDRRRRRHQDGTEKFSLFDDYVSESMRREEAVKRSTLYPKRYELTISSHNEVISRRAFIDESLDAHLMHYTLRLVVNRYGQVGIEQEPDKRDDDTHGGPRAPLRIKPDRGEPKRWMDPEAPPWQTGAQREALQKRLEQDHRYWEEERRRGTHNFLRFPWQYPTP